MTMKNKSLFRICSLLFASAIVLTVSGCSDQVGPGAKPYLNIAGNWPVFVVDSTGERWVTDSNVLVQLSDGSSFHLVPGISEGYSNCFSWSIDDSVDASFHRIVLHANTIEIKKLKSTANLVEAYYYPMVISKTDFQSSVAVGASVAILDSTK